MRDRILKTSVTALAILLASMIVMNICVSSEAKADRLQLNSVYQKAFYETCELLSGMQVNLKKFVVTGSAKTEKQLLNDISMQAQGAQGDLAMLPIGKNAVSSTIKFVNQAGDWANTMANKLNAGASLSKDDRQTAIRLLEACTRLCLQMDSLMRSYLNGDTEFEKYDFAYDGEGDLAPLTNPASEYPTLLYDGPFSDGTEIQPMKALSGEEITKDQAQAALTGFLPDYRIIEYIGETYDTNPVHEFMISKNGYSCYAGVSKNGGKVIYVLGGASQEEILSEQELIQTAKLFLMDKGFGEVRESYYRKFDGILTVNFAPVEEGVTLYPDLLKVQLSMKDASIVGFEATGYFSNHGVRKFSKPKLTLEEAKEYLSENLTAISGKRCLIPYGSLEREAYEIYAMNADDEYLVYIDTDTGEELSIYQIVKTDEGTLVQ